MRWAAAVAAVLLRSPPNPMVFFESGDHGASSASVSALGRAWSLTALGLARGRVYECLGNRAFRVGPSCFVVELLGGDIATLPNAHLAARRLSALLGTAAVPQGAGGYRRVPEPPSRVATVRRALLAWASARRPRPRAPSLPSRQGWERQAARQPDDARR